MKVAIFGGAFDPPHREHVSMLRAVEEEIAPDKIIIVPTAEPPHKPPLIAPYGDRIGMLKAVFGNDYEISEIERELGGKNYSLNLAKAFKARYPDDEILFVLGSDSLRDLKIWHDPYGLSKLVTFVSVPRKDKNDWQKSAEFVSREFGAKVFTTKFQGENISSSVLKGKLLLGLPVGTDVPEAAIRYIEEHGLYRKYSDVLAKLKAELTDALYGHSVRTALFGLRFCSALALPFDDVFLACMFHDVAKEENFPEIGSVARAVAHQFYGAETAENKYGIEKREVLDAICYHTTGRKNMSKLEKLVYAADKLEEGRTYDGADAIRTQILQDFDKGFTGLVASNYAHLKSVGAEIHPLQIECYHDYIKGD